MTRYYFDIRDDTGLYPDEEGAGIRHSARGRGRSKVACEFSKGFATIPQDVSVEVRTDVERVFQAAFIFDRSRTKQ
jgi:hypothetical protein